MKFRDFLAGKAVGLCFLGLSGLFAGACMAFAGAGVHMILLTGALFLITIAGWLLAVFLLERSRLLKLEKLIEELPEKYLLGEVLPRPVNAMEKKYYQIMKQISVSAVGIAEEAKWEKEAYLDYVESWIHEIKTPLTACSLILSNGGDIHKLKRELRRADNLTESILYYARLRTAEKDTQIKKIQASDVIEEAVKSQMEILIASKISIDVQGDFLIYSDRKSVCFILKQLLLNSAKYCPGCRIQICAEGDSIVVEDDGIGIPDYEVHRVTERGFTGRNGKKQGQSTGMGLYIVKELCGRLGIKLYIESEEGVYTRVTLKFV